MKFTVMIAGFTTVNLVIFVNTQIKNKNFLVNINELLGYINCYICSVQVI